MLSVKFGLFFSTNSKAAFSAKVLEAQYAMPPSVFGSEAVA